METGIGTKFISAPWSLKMECSLSNCLGFSAKIKRVYFFDSKLFKF
jgi:hypothetical protein